MNIKFLWLSHPFLFALYPVFFLFNANKAEFTPDAIVFPSILVLTLAAAVFLLILTITRHPRIAAIISSVSLFLFLSSDRITKTLFSGNQLLSAVFSNPFFILIEIGIIALFVGYVLAQRRPEVLKSANKGFMIIAIALLALPVTSSLIFEVQTRRLWQRPEIVAGAHVSASEESGQEKPDIYYLIFDRYASEAGLKEQYGFDNSPFTQALEEEGFYVARQATANYPKTFLSLASSLNMEYVNKSLEQFKETKANASQTPGINMLKNNRVARILKSLGYTYVHLGSWWSPTADDDQADVSYVFKYEKYALIDEFTSGFINTTIIGPLIQTKLKEQVDVSRNPNYNLHRRSIFYAFDTLNDIPDIPGPKFVFAHVLIPHDPYVLDAECTPVDETETKKYSKRENYIAHIQCANKSIQKLISHIKYTSDTDPIIILQADEGPFPIVHEFPGTQPWAQAETGALREKFPILSAYYFPDKNYDALYQTITPVNSFRIILNQYFNHSWPLLEDKNYVYEDESHYYSFSEVTEKVR